MGEKHLKSLLTFKKAATTAVGFGFFLFLFGLFANGYNYLFSILGAGIMVAAVVLFIFGLSLSLMEEYTDKSKENRHVQKEVAVFSNKS